MFPRPDVASELSKFVPVELFTDGRGSRYERNKKLQEQKFGTVALPHYAVVTPDGQALAQFPGLTRDPQEFLAFLRQAQMAAASHLGRSRQPSAVSRQPSVGKRGTPSTDG